MPFATAVTTLAMPRTWLREVGGHHVDVVGEVFPGARDSRDLGLPTELAVGTDFASDAGDLAGEGAELFDHRVDGVLQLEDLPLRLHGDFLREVAVGDGGRDERDVADLVCQIAGEEVDVVRQFSPGTGDAWHLRLSAKLALDAHLPRHRGHLVREGPERVGHVVDGVRERGDLAFRLHHELLRQIAVGDGGHDLGDTSHLAGQVRGHQVDVVGQVFPCAGDALDVGLATELALGTDFLGDASDLRREGNAAARPSC